MKSHIVNITALKEINSKFNLGINIPDNNCSELLLSMYHIGLNTIYDYCKPTYMVDLYTFNETEWLKMLEDLQALLTQLETNNYHILLNDIQNSLNM